MKTYTHIPYYISPMVSSKPYVILLFLVLFSFSNNNYAQQVSYRAPLQSEIKETSGLILLDNKLITHNDSDSKPYLYEIDLTTNTIIRTVEVKGASNTDWEDITLDEDYIYIGDFGNNNGNRSDLKIYRVAIEEFRNTPNDKVQSDIIHFRYSNQTNLNPSPYYTDFDAEALVSIGDNLYVLTKNWTNFNSNIYKVPKLPGNYSLDKMDSLQTNGLVGGATYDLGSNTLYIVGYEEDDAFLISLRNLDIEKFSNTNLDKVALNIPEEYSYQVEGIAQIDSDNFIITSETGILGEGAIFDLTINQTLNIDDIEQVNDSIYPNPAKDYVKLNIENLALVKIYDNQGKLVLESKKSEIYVANLDAGIYLMTVKTNNSLNLKSFKLIIE